jgi:hypothetical protein
MKEPLALKPVLLNDMATMELCPVSILLVAIMLIKNESRTGRAKRDSRVKVPTIGL